MKGGIIYEIETSKKPITIGQLKMAGQNGKELLAAVYDPHEEEFIYYFKFTTSTASQ